MTNPVRDQWAEWLLNRRFGGDERALERHLAYLAPVRDRVLDGARIEAGATVLDLGAGDGLIAFGALERVAEGGTVIFSDISRDLLHHARQLAQEMDVAERCRFFQAPAEDLSPIADGSVDVVTARSVLIYVEDRARAFREIHRVLKPSGRMSVFEPINRVSLPRSDAEFTGGFDVGPVRELAAKVRAVFHRTQPPETDSMLNFDERDLLAWLEDAGFAEIAIDYEVRVGPVPGTPWESYLHTAWNPRIPTLAEAMEEALSPEERERFSGHLRPLVESGNRRFRLAVAYLRAVR
jgi:arsenite methyltransferase